MYHNNMMIDGTGITCGDDVIMRVTYMLTSTTPVHNITTTMIMPHNNVKCHQLNGIWDEKQVCHLLLSPNYFKMIEWGAMWAAIVRMWWQCAMLSQFTSYLTQSVQYSRFKGDRCWVFNIPTMMKLIMCLFSQVPVWTTRNATWERARSASGSARMYPDHSSASVLMGKSPWRHNRVRLQ